VNWKNQRGKMQRHANVNRVAVAYAFYLEL